MMMARNEPCTGPRPATLPLTAPWATRAAILITAFGWMAGGGSGWPSHWTLPAAPSAAAADVTAGQAGLPELVRTKHRTFSIPFRLPASQDADAAAQRVMMSVSKDLGVTWEPAGEVAPSAGSFSYQAGADGEYWFRLRAVDRKGRARGGGGRAWRPGCGREATARSSAATPPWTTQSAWTR
jgi:hypothetical protein